MLSLFRSSRRIVQVWLFLFRHFFVCALRRTAHWLCHQLLDLRLAEIATFAAVLAAVVTLVLQLEQSAQETVLNAWTALERNKSQGTNKGAQIQLLLDAQEDLRSLELTNERLTNLCVHANSRISEFECHKCDLRDIRFIDNVTAEGIRLPGSDLLRVSALRAQMSGLDLAEATLNDVCFGCSADDNAPGPCGENHERATLSFVGTDSVAAGMLSALSTRPGPIALATRINLARSDFSNANLKNVRIQHADLRGAILRVHETQRFSIYDSLAQTAVFSGSFRDFEVRDSRLMYSRFIRARMPQAHFVNVDLAEARFIQSDCIGCIFAPLPTTFTVTFCGADLRHSDFKPSGSEYDDIKSLHGSNVFRAEPEAFRKWALRHGAVEIASPAEWQLHRDTLSCPETL